MRINASDIIEALNEGFAKTYRAFGGYVGAHPLWYLCIQSINDVELLNHIIFCNDVLENPPADTFLKAIAYAPALGPDECRFVGAFWGYVFKFVFGYRGRRSVAVRVNSVKTASFFYDAPAKIKVIKA